MAVTAQTMAAPARTPRRARPALHEGAALFLGSAGAALFLWALLPHALWGYDAAQYAQMAAQPGVFTSSPLGYRLLTPLVVHLLPLPQAAGFFALTVLALAGTATTLGLWCRDLGLGRRGALGAAALFLTSYGARFDLMDFRLVDPLAYLGTALVFFFLGRRRLLPAALAVLGTTLDKEWGLFLILPLLWALWRWACAGAAIVTAAPAHAQRRTIGRAGHTAAVLLWGVLAPLLAYWLLRHWPGFGGATYGTYYSAARNAHILAALGPQLPAALLATGALLWPLAVRGWRAAPGSVRGAALILPGIVLTVLLASDTARMCAFGALLLIPLVLCALHRLRGWLWVLCVAAAVLQQALLFGLAPS